MCVVSMIGDHYNDKWKDSDWYKRNFPQQPLNPIVPIPPPVIDFTYQTKVSQAEFDALKKEVLEMKALLIKALEYDKKNNEPHCEMDEKVALLKEVAKMVGVDLEEIFKK